MMLGGAVAVMAAIMAVPVSGSMLLAKNPATEQITDCGLEIYYRSLTGSIPTVANVHAVLAVGVNDSSVEEILTPEDTMREITSWPVRYIPSEKTNVWQYKVTLAEKIMDSRHGDPISIGKMYWKRLRTGLWDAGLVEPMEQALKHVYGPDMCIATDRVERILSECGRGLDDLDMLADVAAASALIAYVLETNEGALGEYAETARRVTAKRDAAREAVRMKRDEFAAEQHARIAELDQLMHS